VEDPPPGLPEEARTAAVATIVLGQLFYLFNSVPTPLFIRWASFSNVWIWAGAASMVLLQLLSPTSRS